MSENQEPTGNAEPSREAMEAASKYVFPYDNTGEYGLDTVVFFNRSMFMEDATPDMVEASAKEIQVDLARALDAFAAAALTQERQQQVNFVLALRDQMEELSDTFEAWFQGTAALNNVLEMLGATKDKRPPVIQPTKWDDEEEDAAALTQEQRDVLAVWGYLNPSGTLTQYVISLAFVEPNPPPIGVWTVDELAAWCREQGAGGAE